MKKLIFILSGIAVIAVFIAVIYFSSNPQETIERIMPEIRGISLHWSKVTSATTEIRGTVKVFNPNSVSIPVTKISCEITIDGIKVGSGETLSLQIEKIQSFSVTCPGREPSFCRITATMLVIPRPEQIRRLWEQGLPRCRIARVLGRSHTTISKYLKRMALA